MSIKVDLAGDDLVINNLYAGASAPGQSGTLINLAGGDIVLPAGTATTAPLTFTTGTNLTTPAVGALEFDGNALYSTNHASSRQVVDAEQYIIQAADSTADNNTGLDSGSAAAVFTTGSGQITLVAGKTYFFEGCYNITNTGTTSHTWATAFGGTATFNAGSGYQAYGVTGTTASTPASGGLSGFISSTTLSTAVVVTAASTSATEQVAVQVVGTLAVNAGGTLIPQMKASTRPGATGTPGVVHKAGSFFRIWEAPTLGSVGNWS